MGNNINRNDLHSQICKDLHNLYVTKNSDYGNSVSDTFDKFGIDAFLVRMYDKLNRLYSLTRTDTKQMVSDEKIEDTLLDLANYAILTIIELQYKKPSSINANVDDNGTISIISDELFSYVKN